MQAIYRNEISYIWNILSFWWDQKKYSLIQDFTVKKQLRISERNIYDQSCMYGFDMMIKELERSISERYTICVHNCIF